MISRTLGEALSSEKWMESILGQGSMFEAGLSWNKAGFQTSRMFGVRGMYFRRSLAPYVSHGHGNRLAGPAKPYHPHDLHPVYTVRPPRHDYSGDPEENAGAPLPGRLPGFNFGRETLDCDADVDPGLWTDCLV